MTGKKLAVMLLIIAVAIGALIACSQRDPDLEPEPEEPLEPAPERGCEEEERPPEYPTYSGVRNPLTNLPADESEVVRRPILVMMDNHPQARPHTGLAAADLVFEVMAEGGFTRLLGVFLESAPDEVGPIRSARPYHLDLVQSLDAVLVHCGASPEGYRQIKDREMDVFNDLWGAEGFFRQHREGVSYEHTLFASVAEIRESMHERDMERSEKLESPWSFARGSGSVSPDAREALHVEIGYPGSAGYTVRYRFDGQRGIYQRYIGDEPHADASSGEIFAANVLVVEVPSWPKPGDTEGRLHMDMFAGGDGWFISGGEACEIEWAMEPHSPMQFFHQNGSSLRLRQGKTWIQIVPPEADVDIKGGSNGNE